MKYRPACIESLESRSLLAGGALTPALQGPGASRPARENPVIAWNAVALQAIRNERTPPPEAARDLAIVQAAVYDAVGSIAPMIGPAYRVRLEAPGGVSAKAAAVGAASGALQALFPGQDALFEDALARSLARLPSTRGVAAGLKLGRAVAALEVARRADDGSDASVIYTSAGAPGSWEATPPAFASALLPQWPDVEPFVLRDAAQFLPDGPPALEGAEYAAALNEVQAFGSRAGSERTPDQTQIAVFWADGAGTVTPPGHWNEIARRVGLDRRDGILKSARIFAVLNLALADAGIASWDCKYVMDFWRPVTAVRRADTDGNPATEADPTWAPLLATPPFPSYVSGHSTFSAAAATVLSAAYGRDTHFATTSDALPGVTRSFDSFDAAAAEAGMSRIYGGIHYAFDNQDGLDLGRSIGTYALRHAFEGSKVRAKMPV